MEGSGQPWLLLLLNGVIVFLETLGLQGAIAWDYHKIVERIALLLLQLLCIEDCGADHPTLRSHGQGRPIRLTGGARLDELLQWFGHLVRADIVATATNREYLLFPVSSATLHDHSYAESTLGLVHVSLSCRV